MLRLSSYHLPAPPSQRGFTMTELLVTMTIVAIVSAIALPSMRSVMENAKVSGRAEDLGMTLRQARSEAAKRNETVTVCRSSDGAACAAAGVGDWRVGWIMFVDSASVGTREAGEAIIVVRKPDGASGPLAGSGTAADYISYRGDGRALTAAGAAQTGTITACSTNTSVERRRLTFSAGSGAFQTIKLAGSATCTGA